jgi:ribose transport system ATP-binding protein
VARGLSGQERGGPAARCALSVRGLSKTFAGSVALDGVDLDVGAGEIHALLGENGSGKSTLIKILSGYHQPDPGGRVLIDSQPLEFGSAESSYHLGCRFVHQDLGLIAAASVLDNLSLNGGFPTRWGSIRTSVARRLAAEDLARVGVDVAPETAVGLLSPAQRTGVAVARALRQLGLDGQEVKLLVLDEPTATLPETEVEQLLSTVRRVADLGIGVLYVTHRLDEVFELAENATVLRDGRKVATRPVASLDRRGLVSLLVGGELDEVSAESRALHPERGTPVLRVQDLRAGPLAGVSLEARAGDIIGVAGITGSGREILLGAIFGAVERDGGTVAVGDVTVPPHQPRRAMDAGMGYLPAERKTLGGIMEFSARENVTLANLAPFWARGLLRRRREAQEAESWFERLLVRPPAVEAPLMTFSGGNQQKIIFAKWLRRHPAVLLLDEPTQGVDVGAKVALHRQILATAVEGTAVILTSSDVDELAALCHQVIVLRRGRVVARLRGDEITVSAISRESLGADREVATR